MKKASIILLLLVYGISSVGIDLKSFYCCGKLKSVSIDIDHLAGKKCAKEDGSGGCCKTTYHFYKVKDSHVTASSYTAALTYFTDLAIPPYFQTELFASINTGKINGNHAPPLISSPPIYILHCAYRI